MFHPDYADSIFATTGVKMLDLKGLLSKARLPMDITRRGFLEVSTVAAAVAAMNAARAQTGAQPYIILSAPKGILIADPSLCVSCQRCELACTEFNDGKADPRLARIKINRGMFYGYGRHLSHLSAQRRIRL